VRYGDYIDPDNPNIANLPVKDTDALTANTQTFPAGGNRETDGSINRIAYSEGYWSGTPINSSNGYRLYYNAESTEPVTIGNYPHGMSIRCVRI
jgi:hypothetical protein